MTEALLVALAPPRRGRHFGADPLRACVKVAAGSALDVLQSSLELFASGVRIATKRDAFALSQGARVRGPASTWALEERHFFPMATHARLSLEASLLRSDGAGDAVSARLAIDLREPERCNAPALDVRYFPLRVGAEDEIDFVATFTNDGDALAHIARGVQEALLWVDGVPHASVAGRVWNGIGRIGKGQAYRRRFRFDEFPSASLGGRHRLAFEMLGNRTAEMTVDIVDCRAPSAIPVGAVRV